MNDIFARLAEQFATNEETRRAVSAVVNALFEYDARNDAYVAKYQTYSSEGLRRVVEYAVGRR